MYIQSFVSIQGKQAQLSAYNKSDNLSMDELDITTRYKYTQKPAGSIAQTVASLPGKREVPGSERSRVQIRFGQCFFFLRFRLFYFYLFFLLLLSNPRGEGGFFACSYTPVKGRAKPASQYIKDTT